MLMNLFFAKNVESPIQTSRKKVDFTFLSAVPVERDGQ